jgi:dGTPase
MEVFEEETLAGYAQKSSHSAGRVHKEERHPFRTDFQRDRARIIHSKAFRRLESKTQVFLNGTGDHFRTRLTHTMEVASISRTIARALALNEDLAEAIALAHDLGHSPVGHCGEKALNELMTEHGGFEHNAQSLRVVEHLEIKYPWFPGINLTFEVLEGLNKHQKPQRPLSGNKAVKGVKAKPYLQPSLEAQIANIADEITYYSHDIDDGLDSSLISPRQLSRLDVWQESFQTVREEFPKLRGDELNRYVVRCIIDRQVEDVILTSSELIAQSGVRSVEEVRLHPKPLIQYSQKLALANRELRKFLYKNLYYHPKVDSANKHACDALRRVFLAYIKNPLWLPDPFRARLRKEGLHRTACDYISGMTDRFLFDEFNRIFDASPMPSLYHRLSRFRSE